MKNRKEFIPYEQALALKELGFDELCFGTYDYKPIGNRGIKRYEVHSQKSLDYENNTKTIQCILAPLYQQAFRWLYQKLDIEKGVMPLDIESQQLLLKELIDKVSSKHLLV